MSIGVPNNPLTMASTLVAPGLPPDFLQTPYGLGPNDISTQQLEPMMLADADLDVLTFQQSVLDDSSTISRAGLYVYINCLVSLSVVMIA